MSTLGNNILMEYWRQNQIYGPTEGLVFYYPCTRLSDKDYFGNDVNLGAGAQIVTQNGIKCINAKVQALNVIPQDKTFTASFWLYFSGNVATQYADVHFSASEAFANKKMYQFLYRNNAYGLYVTGSGAPTGQLITVKPSILTHFAVTNVKIQSLKEQLVFINGANVINTSSDTSEINANCSFNASSFETHVVSGIRVYNRVLTDAEIATLASEFTPTP